MEDVVAFCEVRTANWCSVMAAPVAAISIWRRIAAHRAQIIGTRPVMTLNGIALTDDVNPMVKQSFAIA